MNETEVTLSGAIEYFLGEKSSNTADSYRPPLERMSDYIGKSRLITDIKPEDLLRYRANSINRAGWADATVHKHIKTMRTFFNWCIKTMRWIDHNPAGALRLPILKRRMDRTDSISTEEFDKLVAYARSLTTYKPRRPRLYALLLFMWDTGARPGEVASVEFQTIDYVKRTAIVRGKTGERRVNFGMECAIALRMWLSHCAERYPRTGPYIWNRNGNYLNVDSIRSILYRACEAAGVRNLSGYYFRHGLGDRLADEQVPVTLAATIMGNTPETMMKSYYPGDEETAREYAKRMAYKPKTSSFHPDEMGKKKAE